MLVMKIIAIALIFASAFLAGCYPFVKRIKNNCATEFPRGEALSCGVFLGAGLIHMLGDASDGFRELGYDYPFAFLLTGLVFLLLLLFEHIGRECYEKQGKNSVGLVYLTVVMLSIHSFLAGAALGFSRSYSVMIIILLAILAHKWAASFALSVKINQSTLSHYSGVTLFLFFALMTPLGVIFGASATHYMHTLPLLEPIFVAMAAGTFLYLGTLHGLDRAVMIEKCCNLKHFWFVVLGFIIMAVVAVWT